MNSKRNSRKNQSKTKRGNPRLENKMVKWSVVIVEKSVLHKRLQGMK